MLRYLIDLCDTKDRAAQLRYQRTQLGWKLVNDSEGPAWTASVQAWPNAPDEHDGKIILVFSRPGPVLDTPGAAADDEDSGDEP